MGQVGPQSYKVKVGESVYRRNRRQLINADEPPIIDIQDTLESPPIETEPQPQQSDPTTQVPIILAPQAQPAPHVLRRSQRDHKLPSHLKDYVTK